MTSPVIEPPPASRAAPSAGATGVLFATAPGPGGAPAAALAWEDTTLLGRLASQFASLGVGDLHVVVRPGDEAVVSGGQLHVCEDAAADLRLVASLARDGAGGMVFAGADIVTQREALAGLLADPRVTTGILATGGKIARPYGYRHRTRRGRVVSASSPFHTTAEPNQTFLGVLKVAAAERERLAGLAEALAALRAAPPEAWTRELEVCKAGTWKLAAARIARNLAEREAREADPEAHEARETLEEADAEVAELAQAEEDAFDRQFPEDVTLSGADAAELRRRLAAAPEEVPALLLVALVRGGVQVGNSFLRTLFWARPLSGEAVAVARDQIADHDEEAELLNSAVKASDGFFTTFFVSPYSKYIARWCARRGLNPNQVTLFSLLLGILAATGFATGERWGEIGGAVLLQLAFTFDCVDGQLARYTRTFSKFGAWLDSIFDRSKEYVVFAGLAIGASRMGADAWVLACAALGLQTTRHAIDFSYPATQHQQIAAVHHAPLEQPGDGFGVNTPMWLRPPPLPLQERAALPAPSPLARAARWWRRVGRRPRVRWAKKVMTFPIGERFAAISVSAALFTPRTTFILMLSWGGFATAYIFGGRLMRALRSTTATAAPGTARGNLELYRDDGPLARRLRVPVPAWPIALVAAGAFPLLAAIVLDLDFDLAAMVAIAWMVLLGGISSHRPHVDRLRWLVPPALRAVEFAAITWIATLYDPLAVPAAFGLLSAVCFREYDLVYRLRHHGTEPPAVVSNLGLGWDGRLVLAFVLGFAGALPTGYWVAGALLATLFVGDAVRTWTVASRPARVDVEEDKEEDAG